MTRSLPALTLLLALLAGCGESSFEVEGACVAALNVDGITFTPGEPPTVASEDVGELHMAVTVYTGCQDEDVVADAPWHSGVSNFLPVGTQIHRVDGFSTTERLTYRWDVLDEWLTLVPLP